MAAQSAFGRISMKLTDPDQASFIEQPFYTNYNFLQDDATDVANKKTAIGGGLANFVAALTENTVNEISISYEVNIF